ncbi:glycine cleavage system H protein [Synergistales bacterium]|nr:glycine cleavage system H protein [Synergistales bacterium]
MNFPSELYYSRSHEWVRDMGGGVSRVGLTDYAQRALGDIVFINMPEVGEDAVKGARIADVESVKAVSDIYSPLTGTVTAVNSEAADNPETINSDPYGAWLIEVGSVSDHEELLDAAEYETFCEAEGAK